jgi:hypothetical protein
MLTRRELLSGGAALLASAALPGREARAALTGHFFTAAESSRRRLLQLTSPVIVANGAVYKDTDFVVTPEFRPTTVGAVFYCHANDWHFENCTIRSLWRGWNPAWGNRSTHWAGLSGFRLAPCRRFSLRGVHVEGLPSKALGCAGQAEDGVIERFSATRCIAGINFGFYQWGGRRMLVDGVRTWGFWGPGVRDQGLTGGDGFAVSMEDSILRNLELSGPTFAGLKLYRSKRVRVSNVLTNRAMIQGSAYRNGNGDGTTDGSQEITIDDLTVAKGIGVNDQGGNGFQVSYNVRDLLVSRFSMFGDGCVGHAIQVWGNSHARFSRGLISGWNGVRNGVPDCACEVGDGSSVNADFESANLFYRQDHRLRMAS